MKFNENLKYLRKKDGLTQEQLAEKLNISRQAVTKWESGQSLPDIENIKEIALLFSVSIDSLLGDVESKSTLKIKKKIDDIGYFIFGIIIIILVIVFSIGSFIQKLSSNQDIIIISYIAMAIMGLVIFILEIKLYLRDTSETILDMTPTKKGKQIRIKHILRKFYIENISWFIFSAITSLNLITESLNLFLNDLINSIAIGLIITIILSLYEYLKIENDVKKLNSDS